METKIVFQNSKGSKLVGIIDEAGNKNDIVIMAHGFSSNKNTKNFVRLAGMLEKEGIPSFRFDFYGHGESGGLFENITISEAVDDILQAISYIKGLGYKKIGLLGSSFGGISSIIAASKTKDLSFLALKSPVSDYWALEKSRYSEEELESWKKIGYRDYIDDGKHMKLNYSFITDFENHNAYAVAKKITIPTLIVHGNLDNDVPYSQSIKLAKCLPNSELVIIEGADHRYTNEIYAQQMLNASFGFIVKQCTK